MRRAAGGFVFGQKGTVAVVGIVGLLLFTVALWVTYRFLVTSLVTKVVLEGTYHARTSPKTVGPERLPKLNGREASVTFWTYIEDSGHTDFFKQILMIGDSVDSARLLVVLAPNSNMMYVVTRTSAATEGHKPLDDLTAYINGNDGARTHCISVVNYVPILRWLMVGVVLDHDIVSVYLDGDLYGVTSLDRQVPVASVISEMTGPLTAGSVARGFNGYISKVTVASYAQSLYTQRALYRAGPVSGNWLLGSVGLSQYRLQWPVEKVSAAE